MTPADYPDYSPLGDAAWSTLAFLNDHVVAIAAFMYLGVPLLSAVYHYYSVWRYR